jgi:hypothetical protein
MAGNGISYPGNGVSFVPGTTIPSDGAVVIAGDSVVLSGPDGSRSFGNVTIDVAGGAVTDVKLPTGSTVITGAAGAIKVQDADGTSVNCSAVIVPQTGDLSYVSVPGNGAIVTDGLAVKMANFGGAGPLDGTASITGGFLTSVNLKNQTDTLVSNGFSVNVGATFGVSGAGSDFATVNVASGGISDVDVSLIPTKAVVANSQALAVPVTGTYTTTATLTVAGGVITGIVLS